MSTEHAPATPSSGGIPSDTEHALATLWLYIGRFELLKLSTEERETLADARDKASKHDDPEEFTPRGDGDMKMLRCIGTRNMPKD